MHKKDQRGGNDQLVGDRVEEGAKRAGGAVAPGEPAVEQVVAGSNQSSGT
jgi:hypothetical protein